MYTIRLGKVIAILAAAAVFCGGCSNKAVPASGGTQEKAAENAAAENAQLETTQQETSGEKKSAMSIEDIYKEIGQKVELKSPECMDDEFISNYYGIDAATLEEYVFSMSEDASQAETIIIMKVKDAGDLAGIAECLQTVVDEKKNEMENYIPEQFAIIEKSKVIAKDNYVWLVISENADVVTDIIESSLFYTGGRK